MGWDNSIEKYRELLSFHIKAQLGMFIDEVVTFAGGAGVAVFSRHEDEPTWNTFFVFDKKTALEQADIIAGEFVNRGRSPVWYQVDVMPALPLPWRRFGSDCWMVCDKPPAPTGVFPLRLRLVDAADTAGAAAFNRLYAQIFWESEPDAEYAVPISSGSAPSQAVTIHHWLGDDGGRAVAMASFMISGDTAAIYNVGTHPALRGKGLARAIMGQVMAAEAAQGIKRFFLITERDRPLAPFYERLGFAAVANGGYYRREEP